MSADGAGSAEEAAQSAAGPQDGFALTAGERAELQALVDDLISATEDRVYWVGPVRDTALEIRRRMGNMLDHAD